MFRSTSSTTTILNSTIINNNASDAGATGGGGGIHSTGTSAPFTMNNTLVANNTNNNLGVPQDMSGGLNILGGNNLIGDAATSGNLVDGVNGNIVGNGGVGTLDPSPVIDTTLADNGGPTPTHALTPGSIAIDAGDNTAAAALSFDQRGETRVVDGDGPNVGAPADVDIGAYEQQFLSLVVDTTVDESDGDFSTGDLSLREAIELANARSGAAFILFDPTVFASPQTITLALGQLQITSDVTLQGTGAPNLTIDGNSASRVIDVVAGTDVTISGVTITGGSVSTDGGGILNEGTLLVTDSAITGNTAADDGAGLRNSGNGVLTIVSSTLRDNVAGSGSTNRGGGVSHFGDSLTVINSTFSGNRAGVGGGLQAESSNGLTLIRNSTFVGNHAEVVAGGIFGFGITAEFFDRLTLHNTLIIGNTEGSNSDVGDMQLGATNVLVAASSHNLIGDGNPANHGLVNGVNGNIAGNGSGGNLDPLTVVDTVLSDNGGPTLTHDLADGSPAFDAGDIAFSLDQTGAALVTDQRGGAFPRLVGAEVDIGALEVPFADLTVTKSDGVTTAVPGQDLTYTIVVTNAGVQDEPLATLTDDFPPVLDCTYTSIAADGASGNTTAGVGNLAETLSLPAGSSVVYTIVCGIAPGATGTLSNTVTITGSVVDSDISNNSATDDNTVLMPEADLSVSKDDGVTSAVPGESVTYTIVAANAGPSDDPSVSLTDTFPAELTCNYTSVAAGGATGNTASGTGNLSETLSLPAGSSVTYTAVCDIDPAATGTLSNTATVSGSVTDPNGSNNTATDNDTALSPEADLSVTKDDGVTSAVPGESVTYTIVAANAGPSDDPSVSLTDTFPAALTCTYTSVAAGGATGNTASGTGNLSETLSLPAGSSVTYTAVCDIDPAATGTLSNTATVSGSVTDPNGSNNTATDNDTALSPEADLSVTKDDGVTSAVPGESVTYTIVAANAGPSDDPSVSLTDPFPAVLTCSYTSAASGGATGNTALGSGDLAETLSLPVGSSVTYTLDCDIDPAASGILENTASISSASVDPDTGNNSATDSNTLDAEADLSIVMTSTATVISIGQLFDYVIEVSNQGPSEAANVVVVDNLPVGLSLVSSSGCAEDPNGAPTCSVGTLGVGASAQITLTVRVDVIGDGQTIVNTASVTSDASDPNGANDSTSVQLGGEILAIPTLSQWSMGLMALLLTLLGLGSIRRQRIR